MSTCLSQSNIWPQIIGTRYVSMIKSAHEKHPAEADSVQPHHLVAVQAGGRLMGTVIEARPRWHPPMRAQPDVMSHHTSREVMPEGICAEGKIVVWVRSWCRRPRSGAI